MLKPFALALLLATAAPAPGEPVRILARTEIAPDAQFGGISGMDGDGHKHLYLISDDRSEHGAARFYRARLRWAGDTLSVSPGKPIVILTPEGHAYPAPGKGAEALDAESIRHDHDGTLVWSSEGDAPVGIGPKVRRMNPKGVDLGRPALPPMFARDRARQRGPRDNLSIEGLSFAADGTLWVALEAPLIEDGPVAGPDRPAPIRLSRTDRDGRLVAQFAYQLDPVRFGAPGLLADNGASEILAVHDRRLLVLERSGAQIAKGVMRFEYRCRLYLADLSQATDVAGLPSLAGAEYRPATKTLLFEFAGDNMEAMAWGPPGPHGERTLLLASDNNFENGTPTRFLLLGLGDALERAAQ